jgi:deoxyribonuclease-4
VKKLPQRKEAAPTLLFGPAGVPESSPKRDSEVGIARVKEVGLDCMELEFVRGVSMGEKKAAKVKAAALEHGVALSVHAPYYINFNSLEPDKIEASKKRLLDSARIGALCGGASVIFHAGYYMGESPAKTFRKIRKGLREVLRILRREGVDIRLRSETTGRASQFGTLDEVIALSAELDGMAPCIDFAHLHAYAGAMNSYDEFAGVLETIRRELGVEALADMHIHTSGIHYGSKGELNHLNLDESDLDYVALLRALKSFGVGGKLICESPNREVDAIVMKEKYRKIRKRKSA